MTHLLKERDERIRSLETEILRLTDHFNRFQSNVSGFLKVSSSGNSKVSMRKGNRSPSTRPPSSLNRTDLLNEPSSRHSIYFQSQPPDLQPLPPFQPSIRRPSSSSSSFDSSSNLLFTPNSTLASLGGAVTSNSSLVGSPRGWANGNTIVRNGNLASPTAIGFRNGSTSTPITQSSSNQPNLNTGILSASSHGEFNGPQSAVSFNSTSSGAGGNGTPNSITVSNPTPTTASSTMNSRDESLTSPAGFQNMNMNMPLNSPSGFSNSSGSNGRTPTLGSSTYSIQSGSISTSATSTGGSNQQRNMSPSMSIDGSQAGTPTEASHPFNVQSKPKTTESVGDSSTSSSSSNPYKSFRVTLDDPCHKVLPAALKKYKIVDDWKLYALFICYGNTERCLSYDEKPLLLFQKLKEAKMNPVFMLRHIRDVKNPIEIAEGKLKGRKDKEKEKDQDGKENDGESEKGRVRQAVAKLSGNDLNKDFKDDKKRESEKEASKATKKEKTELIKADEVSKDLISENDPLITGPAAQLPASSLLPPSSSTSSLSASNSNSNRSYAISIYPYVSEREDEFDVGVGDTFVVLSKAKGWWVVQRDRKANGNGDVDLVKIKKEDLDSGSNEEKGVEKLYRREITSGWVPAGCLLETKIPLDKVEPPNTSTSKDGEEVKQGMSTSDSSTTVTAESLSEESTDSNSISNISIPPNIITSTSTPGIMLMDYSSQNDVLNLKKEDKLRVFKRYNHWSYCVQEGGSHHRGWVPSWYIGRSGRSNSTSGSTSSSKDKSKLSEKEKDGKSKDETKVASTTTPTTIASDKEGVSIEVSGLEDSAKTEKPTTE